MSRGISTKREQGAGKAIYLAIIKGDLMQKVPEGTDGCVKRTYEITDPATQAVTEGHKFEIQHQDLFGKLIGIEFKDSKYGEQLVIKLYNDVDDITAFITTSADGRYGTDFLKKFPALKLEEDVCFNTFDFLPKATEKQPNPKQKKGCSIEQNGEKVYSFFYDQKKRETINGLPPVDKALFKSLGKNYWKIFFITEFAFLKDKALDVAKDFPEPVAPVEASEPVGTEEEGDDLPF